MVSFSGSNGIDHAIICVRFIKLWQNLYLYRYLYYNKKYEVLICLSCGFLLVLAEYIHPDSIDCDYEF